MRFARVFVAIMTVLWAMATAIDCLMVLVSPMMFDAPGSENNPVVLRAFYAVLSFPFVVSASTLGSWFLLEKYKRPLLAAFVILIPVVNVFVLFQW